MATKNKKFQPYKVKTNTFLNIRADAGLEYEKVGVLKASTVEILEDKNGWGRIDKGWINLYDLKSEIVKRV